jgi:DNA-binding NarL/FixJ family response regulator
MAESAAAHPQERSEFPTCCTVGSDVYPSPCPEHGAQVPPDLLDIRVLVVDDHPLVRGALVERLSDEEDLTVVGECEDGSQVLATAAQLRPDVVVMDLSMPVMDGLAATQALRASYPEFRVVMHTAEGSEVRAQVAIAGAHALVPKGIRPDELLGCVRAVVVGGGCCPYCL